MTDEILRSGHGYFLSPDATTVNRSGGHRSSYPMHFWIEKEMFFSPVIISDSDDDMNARKAVKESLVNKFLFGP